MHVILDNEDFQMRERRPRHTSSIRCGGPPAHLPPARKTPRRPENCYRRLRKVGYHPVTNSHGKHSGFIFAACVVQPSPVRGRAMSETLSLQGWQVRGETAADAARVEAL